jgi:hypothetical protein
VGDILKAYNAAGLGVTGLGQVIAILIDTVPNETGRSPNIFVQFGNAHRLSPPGKRGELFTEKLISWAKRTGSS